MYSSKILANVIIHMLQTEIECTRKSIVEYLPLNIRNAKLEHNYSSCAKLFEEIR